IPSDWSPVKIAEAVKWWLERKHDWLLVIDNLDDITVVDGFLPTNGAKNHTLITTRNKDPTGIPAEGLEVLELEPPDSVHLLSILSGLTIQSPAEREQAEQIVKDLHYLPLAIEQAGPLAMDSTVAVSTQDHRERTFWMGEEEEVTG